MFYFIIFISLLLMSDSFKTTILWNYTKITTRIGMWCKKKDTSDLIIQNIYKVNGYKMENIKNELIKNKNYIFHDEKITIKNINEHQKLLVKYKFKNHNFRIILSYNYLKNFKFKFSNIQEPKYLSILNDKEQDITQIINEYSGPERKFYQNIINFSIQDIFLDSDLRIGNDEKFKIIDNKADEKDINKITELIN
jgi:hypothetical protein